MEYRGSDGMMDLVQEEIEGMIFGGGWGGGRG